MHPYIPYSSAEMTLIRERYAIDGPAKLSRQMPGRSPKSLTSKACRMGIETPRRAPYRKVEWDAAMDQQVRREWPRITAREPGRTSTRLAQQLCVPVHVLRLRAAKLGLTMMRVKETVWSEAELELLERYHHLAPYTLAARFRQAGFQRTVTAIIVKRNRMGWQIADGFNAYSAHGLARLMGVSTVPVLGWIKRGLLKTKPRGDSVAANGGPGDRWLILPKDVRAFIIEHIAQIDIARADKYWLVDLLAGGDVGHGKSIPILRQARCGVQHEAADGIAEHQTVM